MRVNEEGVRKSYRLYCQPYRMVLPPNKARASGASEFESRPPDVALGVI